MELIPQKIEIKEKFSARYKELLDQRYDEFIACSTSYSRKSIRINTIKSPVDTVLSKLRKDWILKPVPWCREGFWIDYRAEEKRFDIGNLLEHITGQIYVQDAASMIPPIALDPKPNDLVLDMCAAPGSKTSQIAAMMQNKSTLIANDFQSERLKALGLNIQRMGVQNTIITKMDGNQLRKKGLLFDKILLDAPCSGTGTIRRSLLNLKMWSPQLVNKMSQVQKQLLKTGYDILKSQGTIVYSTCTLEPQENEGVVDWLLNNYPDAELEEINLEINRSQPIKYFESEKYDQRIKRSLRIWPQDNDTEGFFVAKIRKK